MIILVKVKYNRYTINREEDNKDKYLKKNPNFII